MASHPEPAAPKLRWLRALVAAFVAELGLILVAIPIFAVAADPTPIVNLVIPPASFWCSCSPATGRLCRCRSSGIGARRADGRVGGRALSGARRSSPSLFVDKEPASPTGLTPAYLTAHALKIVGAALGGWLVSRKARAAPGA